MPDAAIPIFQTVNLQGEATLEVEAVIKALGLTLPEGEGFIADKNRIEWKNSNGEVKESISGQFLEENHQLNLQAALSSPQLNIRGGVNNDMRILHQAEKGDTTWTLVGPNSVSHFLQIADEGVAGRWRCNFGVAIVSFPGGSRQSNAGLVSHGIGSMPVFIHTEPASGFQGELLNAEKQSPNAVNFEARLQFNAFVPAAGPSALYWIAIG